MPTMAKQYQTTRQTARNYAVKLLKEDVTRETVQAMIIKNYGLTYNSSWQVMKEAEMIIGLEAEEKK